VLVGCATLHVQGKGPLQHAIRAVNVRATAPSPLPPSALLDADTGRTYANWTSRLALNFVDSAFAETGSNSFFRTLLLISCVVAQSHMTKVRNLLWVLLRSGLARVELVSTPTRVHVASFAAARVSPTTATRTHLMTPAT
jgi:hypothetical protein